MRNITSSLGVFYTRKPALVQNARPLALAVGTVLLLSAIGCETTSFFARKKTPAPQIDSAKSALAAIRESRDPGLCHAAFEYLGNPKHIGNDAGDRNEITTILGLALQAEPDGQNRIAIIHSIERLGSPNRFEALAPAVSDKDDRVRIAACHVLGQAGTQEAATKLDYLLVSDSSLDVRLAAADALGHISTREAAMTLLSGIEDPDVAIRYRCRQSLKKITGKDHAGNVGEWRQEIQTANFEELAGRKKLWIPF